MDCIPLRTRTLSSLPAFCLDWYSMPWRPFIIRQHYLIHSLRHCRPYAFPSCGHIRLLICTRRAAKTLTGWGQCHSHPSVASSTFTCSSFWVEYRGKFISNESWPGNKIRFGGPNSQLTLVNFNSVALLRMLKHSLSSPPSVRQNNGCSKNFITYKANCISLGCLLLAVPPAILGSLARAAGIVHGLTSHKMKHKHVRLVTDWVNGTEYGNAIDTPEEIKSILPLILQYLTPQWISYIGLGAVSAVT